MVAVAQRLGMLEVAPEKMKDESASEVTNTE